jgi:hypothetical protein
MGSVCIDQSGHGMEKVIALILAVQSYLYVIYDNVYDKC